MRVLVIEDNDQDYEVVEKILNKKLPDLKLERAKTKDLGLWLVGHRRYDGIITDLRLPDTKSITEVVEELHKATKTPILVISGSGVKNTLDKCLEKGATRFIRKGTSGMVDRIAFELSAMIDRYLKVKKAHELNNKMVA